MYIALDGPGGCGKTTQLELLQKQLVAAGHKLCVVQEPGSTPMGDLIRDILLDKTIVKSSEAQLMLFMAARHQLIIDVIKPALAAGQIVLSDRCVASSFAYQVFNDGQGRLYEGIYERAVPLLPDLILLLDIPAELAVERRRQRDDQYSLDVGSFYRIRRGYAAFCRHNPDRCRLISGDRSIPEVGAEISRIVSEFTFSRIQGKQDGS